MPVLKDCGAGVLLSKGQLLMDKKSMSLLSTVKVLAPWMKTRTMILKFLLSLFCQPLLLFTTQLDLSTKMLCKI